VIVQLFVVYLLSISVNAREHIQPTVAGRLAEGGDRAPMEDPMPRSAIAAMARAASESLQCIEQFQSDFL
jgi:hypothetical protein